MADKVAFDIDLGGLSGYQPSNFMGGNALLKMDGYYSANIQRITPGKSPTSGNYKLTFSLVIQDADEKGNTLLVDVPVSGSDKNGVPNVHRLGQVFESVGYSLDNIKALAANGVKNVEIVVNTLLGKLAHVSVEAETYENKTSSRVRGWVTPTFYADSVSANAHRRPRRAETAMAGAPQILPAVQAPQMMSVAPSLATGLASMPAALPQMPAPAIAMQPAPANGGMMNQLKGLGITL